MSKQLRNASSGSNISVDSLEGDFSKKSPVNDGRSDENVDTILVPFYEKDVLVKVPKDQKIKKVNREGRSRDRLKTESHSSYLVNKHKAGRTTYLEMFRKQLMPHQKHEKKPVNHDIRSLSPEVGDTERESICDDANIPATEFYNTESYNEMYYEKILCQDLENYLNNSLEELEYTEDVGVQPKSPQEVMIENLRSVSDVSQVRHHHVRRATVPVPLDNVKLGGLGPDMERIKPRLERARSLQRYSEKVRMENRLKIYKKSVQIENENKHDRETSMTRQRKQGIEQKVPKDDLSASYLIKNNKPVQEKNSQVYKLYTKSYSAVERGTKVNQKGSSSKSKSGNILKNESNQTATKNRTADIEAAYQRRAKSSTRNKGINTDKSTVVPDVHINFMVNVDRGVRASSALKTLEEKHRMYQEQIKAFKMDRNDN